MNVLHGDKAHAECIGALLNDDAIVMQGSFGNTPVRSLFEVAQRTANMAERRCIVLDNFTQIAFVFKPEQSN